jgi:hypothetical protein
VECSEVSLLLSEYVDDVLDSATRGLVEEHLTACRGCAAELHSLHVYLRAMAGMEKVSAPPGFLAAVHERLDHPSNLKRLVRWLFYPLKIKLPMELAGIALATLLLVFSSQAPKQNQIKALREPSEVTVQQILRADEKRAALDKADVGQPLSPPRRIELALLLPTPKVAEYKTKPPMTAPPPEKKIEPNRQEAHEEISRQPSALLQNASPAPRGVAGKDKSSMPSDLSRTLELIRDSVAALGGNALPAISDTESIKPGTIVVRIPARSYPRLLESLRQLGHLEKSHEEPDGTNEFAEDNKSLEVQIEIVSPR